MTDTDDPVLADDASDDAPGRRRVAPRVVGAVALVLVGLFVILVAAAVVLFQQRDLRQNG